MLFSAAHSDVRSEAAPCGGDVVAQQDPLMLPALWKL